MTDRLASNASTTVKSYFIKVSVLFSFFLLLFTITIFLSIFILRQSAVQVVEKGIPVIDITNNLSEISAKLKLTASNIATSKEHEELNQHDENMQFLIKQLSAHATRESKLVQTSEKISAITRELFKSRKQYITLQLDFNNNWKKYSKAIGDLTYYTNDIETDLSLRHWQFIQQDVTESNTILEKIYREKDQISKLSSTIKILVMTSERIPQISDGVFYSSLYSAVELAYRNAVRTIGESQIAEKQKLITTLLIIYDQIYLPDGLFSQKRKIIDIESQLQTLTGELNLFVTVLTQSSSQVISAYHKEAKRIANNGHNISSIILLFAFTFLLVFPIILYLVFFNGLYNRIISKIATLTDDINKIANNNLETDIKNYQFKEFSEASNALEIFKENAKKLKKTTCMLTEKVKELSDSNHELEKFNHITSHDLKSPIQASEKLISWVISDKKNSLSEESNTHLNLLLNRTIRLKKLLKDLSTFTQISKTNEIPKELKLSQVVQKIFQKESYNDHISINFEDTTIFLPPTAFEIVIRNIISNSVQHSKSEKTEILISHTKKENLLTISIKDDGPGIPKNLQNKAMQMFETLTSRDDSGGSGLGLTIVEKIMKKFHGEIEINSDGKSGTEVIINWPIDIKDENHQI